MIKYLIDSENIGTKWISYLDENIEELDKAFLFYTDASKSISVKNSVYYSVLSINSKQYIVKMVQQMPLIFN